MLTLAFMFGVSMWLLQQLAFAILLLWAWGATAALADEVAAELSALWADRPQFVRIVI